MLSFHHQQWTKFSTYFQLFSLYTLSSHYLCPGSPGYILKITLFYKEKIFFSLRSKPMQMLTRVWNGLNATFAINVSHTELVLSDTWSCTPRTTPSPVNSAARSSETEQSRRTTGVPTLASDPTCVISVAALSTHALFGWTTPGSATSSRDSYFK